MRVLKVLPLCVLLLTAAGCGGRFAADTAPTPAESATPIALPTPVPTVIPTATPGPEAYLLDSLQPPEIWAFSATGHTGGIGQIELSPDDRRAAVLSADGTLKVWDLATGKATLTLCAVQGVTCDYAILTIDSMASKALAVAPSETDLRFVVLDLISGAVSSSFSMPLDDPQAELSLGTPSLFTVPGYPGPSLLAEFSDDASRIFVYAVATGELSIFGAEDGERLLSFQPEGDSISAFGFSPDGRRAITAPWEVSFEGLTEAEMQDLSPEQLTWDFIESYYIRMGLMTAEGMQLPEDQLQLVGGELQLWDTESGALLHTLEGHSEPVFDIEFADDRMFTASLDGTVRAWDLESGAEIYAIEAPGSPFLSDLLLTPQGTRALMMVSPDPQSLPQMQVWNVADGRQVSALQGEDWDQGQERWLLPISEDAALGVEADYSFVVWDLATGERLREQELSSVSAIAVTSDGRRAVAGDRFSNLELWDFDSLTVLRSLESAHAGVVTGMAVLPDGTRLLTGADDGSLRIWDIERGTELSALPVGGEVRAIAPAPDGGSAAVLFDQRIDLWDLTSESAIWSNPQVGSAGVNLFGGSGSLDFTPDGARILLPTGYGRVTVLDAASGAAVSQIEIGGRVADTRVHVLEGGEIVIVLQGGDSAAYEWQTGEPIVSLDSEFGAGIQSNVSTLSADRTRLAFALLESGGAVSHLFAVDFSGDGLIFLRDNYPERIKSMAFTADGSMLLTGSADHLRLWDLDSGMELGALEIAPGPIKAIAVSPDGARAFLLAGTEPLFEFEGLSDVIYIIDLAGWIEDLS